MPVYDCLLGKLLSVKEVSVWVRSVSLRLFVGKVAVSKRGLCGSGVSVYYCLWGKLLSVKEVSVWVSGVSLLLFMGKVAVSKRGFCVGQECPSFSASSSVVPLETHSCCSRPTRAICGPISDNLPLHIMSDDKDGGCHQVGRCFASGSGFQRHSPVHAVDAENPKDHDHDDHRRRPHHHQLPR